MVLMVTGWVPSAGRAPCRPEPPSPYGLRRLGPARRHDTAVASPRPHTLRRTEPAGADRDHHLARPPARRPPRRRAGRPATRVAAPEAGDRRYRLRQRRGPRATRATPGQ